MLPDYVPCDDPDEPCAETPSTGPRELSGFTKRLLSPEYAAKAKRVRLYKAYCDAVDEEEKLLAEKKSA